MLVCEHHKKEKMIRYQQKNPTLGMNLAAAAGGYARGQAVGNAVVSAAPAVAGGVSALRMGGAVRRPGDLPGPRNAAFYGQRYGTPVPEGQGTTEQMDILRAQRIQGARIAEARNRVQVGRYHDMDPPGDVERYASSREAARRARASVPAASRLRTQAHITAFASSPEDARRAAALV